MDVDKERNPSGEEGEDGRRSFCSFEEFQQAIRGEFEDQLSPDGVADEDDCSTVRCEQPPEVKRRVKALLKIQLDISAMRAALAKDIQEREFQFAIQMKSLEEKRQLIVVGLYEPTDLECDLTGIPGLVFAEDQKDNQPEQKQKYNDGSLALHESMKKMAIGHENQNLGATCLGFNSDLDSTQLVSGIPNFWSETLQGSSAITGLMEDDDLPILKYLENITVDVELSNAAEQPFAGTGSYTLRFHFRTNPFFTNSVLYKTFFTQCSQKPEAPISVVDEPWPISAMGCEIKWIEGRNVTMQTVKRKQRNSHGGVARFVVSTLEKMSFFHFFKTISALDLAASPDLREELEDDYRIGEIIRKKIIPFATLYHSFSDEMDSGDSTSDSDDDSEHEVSIRGRDRNRKVPVRIFDLGKIITAAGGNPSC